MEFSVMLAEEYELIESVQTTDIDHLATSNDNHGLCSKFQRRANKKNGTTTSSRNS